MSVSIQVDPQYITVQLTYGQQLSLPTSEVLILCPKLWQLTAGEDSFVKVLCEKGIAKTLVDTDLMDKTWGDYNIQIAPKKITVSSSNGQRVSLTPGEVLMCFLQSLQLTGNTDAVANVLREKDTVNVLAACGLMDEMWRLIKLQSLAQTVAILSVDNTVFRLTDNGLGQEVWDYIKTLPDQKDSVSIMSADNALFGIMHSNGDLIIDIWNFVRTLNDTKDVVKILSLPNVILQLCVSGLGQEVFDYIKTFEQIEDFGSVLFSKGAFMAFRKCGVSGVSEHLQELDNRDDHVPPQPRSSFSPSTP